LSSEHQMIEGIFPGLMPPLPSGFADKYKKETAKLDSPEAFHPKSVYTSVFEQQRAGTLKALDKLTDADLDKASPEQFKDYAPTSGDLMVLQGVHWLMHAGQWAIVRRKLGKQPLF